MSLKSRYTFIKKYYPNHLFVFVKNKDYKYYGINVNIESHKYVKVKKS